MKPLSAPINNIFTWVNSQANTSLNIKTDINDFFDLVKYRLEHKASVNEVLDSLSNEFFKLRNKLIIYFLSLDVDINQVTDTILEEIQNKYLLGIDEKLKVTYQDALDIYLKIVSNTFPVVEEIKSSVNLSHFDFDLSDLKALLGTYPNKELKYTIDLIETSLEFEFYLIIAEKVITKEISLNSNKRKELENSFKNALINYAAYMCNMGFWDIYQEEETSLIRNIKIKRACFEMENLVEIQKHSLLDVEKLIFN